MIAYLLGGVDWYINQYLGRLSIHISVAMSVKTLSTLDSQLRLCRVSVKSQLSLYQYVGNTHRYILVADSRPMVGRYFTNGSPTYHRHLANITADTSVDMSLHTSVEWRSSMPTVSRESATSWLIYGQYLTTTVYRSIVGHCFADGSLEDHRWMICWSILDRQ